MSFTKKIFQDGQTFSADDANNIQDQYSAAVEELDSRQADFALSLFNETQEGNGVNRNYALANTMIAQPIVLVKRLADASYKAESVALDTSAQWRYALNSTLLQQLTGATLLAGEYVRVGYIIKALPHKDTHKTGGSDAIDIHDIGGLTQAEIQDLVGDIAGVTSDQATTIAQGVKADSSVAAVVRTVSNVGSMLSNEIAILSV